MITVEEYKESDIDDIVYLFNQWEVPRVYTKEDIRLGVEQSINLGKCSICIAKYDNKAVGYSLYGSQYQIGFDPYIEVMQILVSNDYRKKGIGEKMMKYIEADASKMGIGVIKLSSQIQRGEAHRFYLKMGYTVFKESKFFEKKI